MKFFKVISCISLLMFLTLSALQSYDLDYKNRGNRYEGIRPEPISGESKPYFELLSAIIDIKDKPEILPDMLKIKFYIEELSDIYITIRDVKCSNYYWLDKITPDNPWDKGFNNNFTWSTGTVLQHLDNIKMYDLGVVIRLNKPVPSASEEIAPAVFYYGNCPSNASGYIFILKTNLLSRIKYSVYNIARDIPILTKYIPRQNGNSPFTINFLINNEPDGIYVIDIKGIALYSNDDFEKRISFYHKSVIK